MQFDRFWLERRKERLAALLKLDPSLVLQPYFLSLGIPVICWLVSSEDFENPPQEACASFVARRDGSFLNVCRAK